VIAAPSLVGAFWGRAIVTVDWRKLCHLVYAVDPAVLSASLPPGTSLDLWGDRAIVELVLWSARDLKVLGVKLPERLDTIDVGLRYLVHEGPRRGRVSIAEYSSSTYAAIVARALFKEPTQQAPAAAHFEATPAALVCSYQIEHAGHHQVSVRAAAECARPAEQTLARFVVDRPYTYARSPKGTLLRGDVDHAPLEVYPVQEHECAVDFGALYGQSWAFLNGERPIGVVLAEGAFVRVSLPE
jgi:uncharacterized protein